MCFSTKNFQETIVISLHILYNGSNVKAWEGRFDGLG